MPLIYYDFETTGLNQFHDNLTEYCFIKEDLSTENKPTLTSLVNPEKEIPHIVTKITGITYDTVKNSPNFHNQSNEILEFLQLSQIPTYFVAHNGDNFDFIIIREQFKKSGYNIHQFPIFSIDTLLLAKKLYPHLPKHNLTALCKTFNCYNGNAHRAKEDTEMLRNLYIHICGDLSNILGVTPIDIINNPEMVYNYIKGIY
jgi:DNA polymerase III alpha subunit (gram-positive type)